MRRQLLSRFSSDFSQEMPGSCRIYNEEGYRCWEKGLILTFLSDNVLRIQPPLVISGEEAEKGLTIVEESIKDYQNGAIGDEALRFAKGWS